MTGHTKLALALVILATLYVIFSNVCISIYARWRRELMWGDWEEELDRPPFIPFHQTDLGFGLIVVGALFCLGMAVLSGKTVVDSRKAGERYTAWMPTVILACVFILFLTMAVLLPLSRA